MDPIYIFLAHIIILVLITSTLWLIVKVLLKKKTKTRWILLAGVISTPILYQVFVWTFLFWFVPRTPTRDFDEVTWRNELDKRPEMIDDLVNSEVLMNQSASEVLHLLGKPNYGDTTTHLGYDVGWQYINGRMNHVLLELHIENGQIRKIDKSPQYLF